MKAESETANYGVDAVSGKNEGKEIEDTSNHPHIESFVNDLKAPHELHHAMYHAAKRLVEHEKSNPTANTDESKATDEHDETEPITMQSFEKLKD